MARGDGGNTIGGGDDGGGNCDESAGSGVAVCRTLKVESLTLNA